MKAAVLFKANTPLEIVDLTQEGPRAGEARVKVKAAGICHSDWHIMNGDWTPPLPMVLGHEAAGIVEEVGAGVVNVKPATTPLLVPAAVRTLSHARSGGASVRRHTSPRGNARRPLSPEDKGRYIYQMARIGTFSERVVCRRRCSCPPEGDPCRSRPGGCCVPTGVGAVTRCAEVEAGASVLVVGCGGVGLNVVQGARLAGAGIIAAADLLDNKLTYAKEFGATHTFNASRDNVVDRVRELTAGRGVDMPSTRWRRGTTLRSSSHPPGRNAGSGMAAMNVRAPIALLQALQGRPQGHV